MTKRQLLAHFVRTLRAYQPGIANRTGLREKGFIMKWAPIDSPAATWDGTIYLQWAWFSWHQDDYGALVHEYTHLIQDVPAGTCPGEVIEGFADAMRYIFGLFDPSWWKPSPMAKKIAALPYEDFRELSRAMSEGRYVPETG